MTDVPRPAEWVTEESESVFDERDRLDQLRELSSDAGPDFAGRVTRAIERRRLTNLGLEFVWAAPFTMLREFLGMAWRFSSGNASRKEDER